MVFLLGSIDQDESSQLSIYNSSLHDAYFNLFSLLYFLENGVFSSSKQIIPSSDGIIFRFSH